MPLSNTLYQHPVQASATMWGKYLLLWNCIIYFHLFNLNCFHCLFVYLLFYELDCLTILSCITAQSYLTLLADSLLKNPDSLSFRFVALDLLFISCFNVFGIYPLKKMEIMWIFLWVVALIHKGFFNCFLHFWEKLPMHEHQSELS